MSVCNYINGQLGYLQDICQCVLKQGDLPSDRLPAPLNPEYL